jgi:hypothetical protein
MRRSVARSRGARFRAPGARLTVAVPLHRSAPWVDTISENLGALPAGSHVLLSDATRADDALSVLRRRFRRNRRVRVIDPPPDAGWRANYNHLLAHGRTDLFAWLPHDDCISAGYYERLVDALDEHASAALAFGSLLFVGLDHEVPWVHPPPPIALGIDRPEYEAVVLARDWNLGVPFRGVFRREWARPVPPTRDDCFADQVWVFGMALSGRVVEARDAVYVKRFHADNTHKTWTPLSATEYADAYAGEIRAGSKRGRELATDVEARVRAAFADR